MLKHSLYEYFRNVSIVQIVFVFALLLQATDKEHDSMFFSSLTLNLLLELKCTWKLLRYLQAS